MTQAEALSILKTGGNVFLTGEPGAGKTYVLNRYIDWLEVCGVSVAVTASTGIAATHIGGYTIHSWSGIGILDTLSPYDLDKITSREKVVKRINKARVLVIDEVSMLDGSVLDMVETVCRTVRQKAEPFGGLQVVLVGDFFQLPPITRRGDVLRFAFESYAWDNLRPLVCYISEQYRQEDELLLGLLSSIRKNEVEEDHYLLLQDQKEISVKTDIEPTRLFTHNANVDQMNAEKLAEIKGNIHTFKMEGRGQKALVEGLKKSCLSPEVLELKEEAMVMCTKNNFDVGYVNGTLGRITHFDSSTGFPVIETSDGREIRIESVEWSIAEDNKVLAEIVQVPLRLAWAITVHKSQGMSLDAAEMDLSKTFEYGQGYVALSRVRSLKGLRLTGMNSQTLLVHPKILERDAAFRNQSDDAEKAFNAMSKGELATMHERFVKACGGALPKSGEKIAKRRPGKISGVSTIDETLELLKAKKQIAEIAKARELRDMTVWNHIEKLSEFGKITAADIDHLIPKNIDWHARFEEIRAAFLELGTERLKPAYEATGEKYPYEHIRLVRLLMS